MKTYCRNCQERIRLRDGLYEQVMRVEYIDPTECRAGGGEHVPR